MKHFLSGLLFSLALLTISCSQKIAYEEIATFQDNDIPDLDINVTDATKVLVVVPHADDETVAGGLIALLRDRGATIHLLMLCKHNDTRTKELECSANNLGIEQIDYAGFVNNSWEDIMKDSITFWYDHQDSIKKVISSKINAFKPNFMITYDAEIGGYGHPEHRIAAELTEEVFKELKSRKDPQPEKIFQITLSEKLEAFLVAKSPGYDLAKKLTGSSGLPKPNVAVDIKNYWEIKNAAGHCHQSQINILEKFYIVYPPKNKEQHINAFSKEYYKIVE